MMDAVTNQTGKENSALITFQEFLEKRGPSNQCRVSDLCSIEHDHSWFYSICTPELHLHCDHERCNGLRYFRYQDGQRSFRGKTLRTYLTYLCSNCQERQKFFSLNIAMNENPSDVTSKLAILMVDSNLYSGIAYKYGELPAFGPNTPPRLQKLLEDQLDVFMKGRRCETQGLGIGAFVYYRRVVEHQKNRFLSEIIAAAKLLNASDEQIALLEAAKNETQFSKAIASGKDALPQALLVHGHNPLTLLHSALSGGVHEHTDEECLALAQDIRVLLVELAERLSQVLKDTAEIKGALSRLLKQKTATAK